MNNMSLLDAVMYFVLISALLFVGIFIIMVTYTQLFIAIDEAKRKYIMKHRFDKPPIAKCYCFDCVYHDKYRCTLHNTAFPHDAFCKYAEPKSKPDDD